MTTSGLRDLSSLPPLPPLPSTGGATLLARSGDVLRVLDVDRRTERRVLLPGLLFRAYALAGGDVVVLAGPRQLTAHLVTPSGLRRIATAREVAPAADGRGLWLTDRVDGPLAAGTLRQVGLDGRPRGPSYALPGRHRVVLALAGGDLLVQSFQDRAPLLVWDPARARAVLRVSDDARVLSAVPTAVLWERPCGDGGPCPRFLTEVPAGRRVAVPPAGPGATAPPVLAPDGRRWAQTADADAPGRARLDLWALDGTPPVATVTQQVTTDVTAPVWAKSGWLFVPGAERQALLAVDPQRVVHRLAMPEGELVAAG